MMNTEKVEYWNDGLLENIVTSYGLPYQILAKSILLCPALQNYGGQVAPASRSLAEGKHSVKLRVNPYDLRRK